MSLDNARARVTLTLAAGLCLMATAAQADEPTNVGVTGNTTLAGRVSNGWTRRSRADVGKAEGESPASVILPASSPGSLTPAWRTRLPDAGKSAVELPAKLLLRSSAPNAVTNEMQAPPRADASKLRVEAPVKMLLRSSSELPQPPSPTSGSTVDGSVRPDMSKRLIERPSKVLLNSSSAADSAPLLSNAKADNSVAKPGLVNWHPDYESTLAAARSSHKPVLVFQMMGKLDQEFC